MSDLPGCACRRSLSVSGLTPGKLFSASPAICGPTRLERDLRPVQGYGMEGRGWIGRHGFWPLALHWLPAGIVAPPDRCPGQAAAVGFGPDAVAAGRLGPWLATMALEGLTLALFVSCGLPLALGCRRLWRLGYRRGAWTTGIALGAVTVAVTLPAWFAWWWLAWRG